MGPLVTGIMVIVPTPGEIGTQFQAALKYPADRRS